MKYQLIVMGPRRDFESTKIGNRLDEAFRDLNLDPSLFLERIRHEQKHLIEWRAHPVGVWFAGVDDETKECLLPGPQDLVLLDDLLRNGVPVLPLAESRNTMPGIFPDRLKPLNGREWGDEKIFGDLLNAFRLTHALRRTFVSYKRSVSSNVAEGLFGMFSLRGYHVFLDIASIEAMSSIEESICDRLADMDLLVLLDAPNTLTSQWVLNELTRVHALGISVLQLVWPRHVPFPGTQGRRTLCGPWAV